MWNQTTVRYTEFWDAGAVLKKLAGQPVNWHSIDEFRDRLIFVCRLLHLHRSIDLCRTLRTVSLQGDKMFILVRRKGMLAAQWEEVMKMDGGGGGISPLHLMKHYVHLTKSQAEPGSALLRCLSPPYAPLSANAIGSLTRKC